jgi:hypothetical protein|nr:MAG TPA: hypothetical protein [Caudoviricetes sp.]
MSILTDKLPDYVVVEGREYQVYTDYRNWVNIELMLSSGTTTAEGLAEVLELCYVDALPPSLDLALQGLYKFYTCGKQPVEKSHKLSKNKAIYNFDVDAEYIYSAFLSQYQIDLQTADLHWWTFRSLFTSLNEDNMIVKIMQYRVMDISKIKDKQQKAYYRKLKRKFALPDMRTTEQKERDMMAVIDRMV